MYKVISNFTDLKDNNHHYKVGDVYPRDGYTPTQERIEYLASNNTRRKSPVIAEEKPKRARRKKKE